MVFLQAHHSNQIQLSQYEALLRIKQQLNFPQELTNWSENAEFCNSEPTQVLSLACYEDNITQLHFTGNSSFLHLSPDFSALFSNIASLPNLKVLSLVNLGLKGPLPSRIGDLSSLEILNLSSNSLDGSVPREISSMRNLQTLVLDHNSFNGEIPDWLASLPSLTVLSLKNNSFVGSIPNALSTVTTLRTLALSANNLSGQVPALDNLTNLQVLDLEDNNLGPQFPSLPTKVVSLILRKNKFHSAVAEELGSCYQLQKVDISLNELVGAFPTSLLSLNSLTYVDIGGNKFTGKLSQNMSCNAQLVFVNISQNRLTGDLPDCLKQGTLIYDGNCLSRMYENQHPLSFCHSEALAVGIAPKEPEEKRTYGRAVLASSMVGGIVGAMAISGLAFVFVKRGFAKQNQNVSLTTLIVDKVSPAYTLQMLKDASKCSVFFFIIITILVLFSLR